MGIFFSLLLGSDWVFSCSTLSYMLCSVVFLFFSAYRRKNIVSVPWKAITWGRPLVIAPYNESVGPRSFDSCFTFSLPEKANSMIANSHTKFEQILNAGS